MTNKIESVCVYCGASNTVEDTYKNAIRTLGHSLAKAGKTLVYGGGSVGTMGIVSRAAMEAGGHVIGIIPEHIIEREGQDDELTELHVVDSMHTRKMLMVEKSDAFIAMPGGMGTLDETFEILTWKYLGLHNKPVVLANINGYWDHLLKLLDSMIESGYTPKRHLDLFHLATTPEEIMHYIENYDLKIDENTKIDKM